MGTESPVVLRANGMNLGYGRREVLRGVDWTVRRGERWFIVGPNGQGKTTLMRGVLGLIPADGLERDPGHTSPDRIGFVPQRCEFNPSLPTTLREFVLLGVVGQSVPRRERLDRLGEALAHVRLDTHADRDYHALSGGQRQRALLARALIRRPCLLLLDEPTTGLDPASEESLMSALMERNERDGLTIFLITHDVELAVRYATHAALVFGGTVHAGNAREVLTPDRLAAAYGVPIAAKGGVA